MSRTCPSLRQATADDFRAFFGRPPPPAGTWSGYVAERDGRLIGFAALRGIGGKAWVSVDSRERLPAATMHRTALLALADLGRRGLAAVHAHPDRGIEGAEKWLMRLGFEPDQQMTEAHGEQIWTRRLADG